MWEAVYQLRVLQLSLLNILVLHNTLPICATFSKLSIIVNLQYAFPAATHGPAPPATCDIQQKIGKTIRIKFLSLKCAKITNVASKYTNNILLKVFNSN